MLPKENPADCWLFVALEPPNEKPELCCWLLPDPPNENPEEGVVEEGWVPKEKPPAAEGGFVSV